MNLQSRFNHIAGEAGRPAAAAGFFRQIRRCGLFSSSLMISLFVRASACVLSFLVAQGALSIAMAQTNYYGANGTEYAVIGALAGDQVFPDIAISTVGGFIVWQDNITDGDGWGISARRLDGTLSGTLSTFRVNQTGVGDQEHPHVALLKNGGAAFVWEGGIPGFQHVYARFLTASNTFLSTNDILVNSFTNNFQINPSLAVLTNGNVVVVWASYNQAGSNSMQDVYGQILSPAGAKVGGEFLVNQSTAYNQRTPVVVALRNGNFVVGWVSEQQRMLVPNLTTNMGMISDYTTAANMQVPSVDVYARLFRANGTSVSGEFLVNTGVNPCANPAAAVAGDGSFTFVWGEHDRLNKLNSWDVYARAFTDAGVGGIARIVNTRLYGDQFSPRISGIGLDYLVTWTSLGQDGSRDGIFAQYVHSDGALVGSEFCVNTTTAGQQMQSVVASDGVNQFLAVWTSFAGAPNDFDLRAQRYANVAAILQPMSAPCVWVPFVVVSNKYQPQLMVSWPPLLGLSVSNYEVYVDGASAPSGVVTSNQWIMTAANGLAVNSTHSFQVDYITTDGRRSPMSPSASGTTWSGYSWGGIPFEWMTAYFGSDLSQWSSAGSKLAANLTLYQVFLSGGNPLDSSTWLHQQMNKTAQGMFLAWNTLPGATYQVQVTTNLTTWSNFGSPRFAAGATDSVYVGGGSASYYRVILLR